MLVALPIRRFADRKVREPRPFRGPGRRLVAGHGMAIALAILATVPVAAAPRSKHPGEHDTRVTIERTRSWMGATCTVTAEGSDSSWTMGSVDVAMNEIDRLDGILSSWRQDSELNRLNAAGAEQRIQCSPDLYAVTDSSLSLARATDGAFDPAIEPYNRVWDMRGAGRVPDASELADARERAGWIMVQTEPGLQTVRFRRDGMGLDFGSMSRGYALDLAAELLRQRRLLRVLLSFGDERVAFTDGEAWVVEIADPTDHAKPIIKLVLRHGAVSTMGQGDRGITVNGRHYGPIFDPHSGRPLDTDATVTVVARSGELADGIATALLVMGRDKAAAWCADHREIGALWLEPENDTIRAWRWNLPTATAEPGVRIEWMP